MRARLFGLELDAGFPIVGVADEGEHGVGGEAIALELAPHAEVVAGWAPERRLSDQRDSSGRTLQTIDLDAAGDALVVAPGWGAFRVGRERIACAPEPAEPWRWQRYLIGQVLPLAAALRGIELLHAAAVARDGGAVAVVGRSQAGKSTLAAAWLAAGAPLVADDVVALTRQGDEVIVHPGPGLLSLRHGAAALLGETALARIGRPVGRDDEGDRLAVTRHRDTLPLRALLILERRAEPGPTRVQHEPTPDPRLLLGATFNLVDQTPERLERLLDLCAAIAAAVPVHRVSVGSATPPSDAAASRMIKPLFECERQRSTSDCGVLFFPAYADARTWGWVRPLWASIRPGALGRTWDRWTSTTKRMRSQPFATTAISSRWRPRRGSPTRTTASRAATTRRRFFAERDQAPARAGRLDWPSPRRGGRVAEGTRLLSEYGAHVPSRVRIPPSPLRVGLRARA